ncbi:MAG: hypothetical protein NC204_07015 [Candidatus Amulumruptor caecigallinarius]|nr:hypothetical protein [Candidatus Amulumruptor caecigallinarius]
MKSNFKSIAAAMLTAAACMTASAQDNVPNRTPEWGNGNYESHSVLENNTGFWIAAEAAGAYTLRTHSPEFALAEIDVTAGWRFNDFLRVGVGIGGRWYSKTENEIRRADHHWSMPIYANIRGNMMRGEYRTVVPYYSFDIGGSCSDGFMLRPSVGIRVGQPRKAFTIALSYTLQQMRGWKVEGDIPNISIAKTNRMISFLGLRMGFEY